MSKFNCTLTAERLRELLDYDPETGAFVWRINRNKLRAGTAAGRINNEGYLRIKIDRTEYYAQRLAWLHVHGEFPAEEVDHINRVRADNRLSNIRPATRSENSFNRGTMSNNRCGVKGVHWGKANNAWIAKIRRVYLGSFPTIELAIEARRKAELASPA